MLRQRVTLLWVSVLVLLARPAYSTPVWVWDPYEQALPANPCLPVSQEPILFTGQHCDGPACPPGTLVDATVCWLASNSINDRIELGGRMVDRITWLNADYDLSGKPYSITTRINPLSRKLELSSPEGSWRGEINITYDGGTGWDVSPTAMGATEIRFRIEGAVSPERPLRYYLLLEDTGDGTEESLEFMSTAEGVIQAPGDVVIPLSDFKGQYEFDLNGLDWIVFTLGTYRNPETNQTSNGPDISIGPVRFETPGPVSARKTSWGKLKAIYR